MSQTMRIRLFAASLLVGLVGAVALAVPFDPVFRVVRFKGECQVALPDSTTFAPVKPGKAYPYGTTVRTGGAESEATITFCDNHECRLAPNTTARFADEARDRTNLTVHLLAGKVEVDLDQKNIKYINRVFVQTPVAIAAGEKVRFTAAVSRNNDIHESVFECGAGMFGVSGSQFQAPAIKEGSIVKVTGPSDLSWLRVQTVKGEVSYDLRDTLAEPVAYPTKQGGAFKITQRVADSTKSRHVVVWTLKPDDTTETNYTYRLGPQAVIEGAVAPANVDANQQPAQQGI